MTNTGETPTIPFPAESGTTSPTETLPTGTAGAAPVAGSPGRRRYPPKIGTIVWGFLVTGFAVVVAVTTNLVQVEDPTAWLIGGLLVGGAALVVAGIAAAARRAD